MTNSEEKEIIRICGPNYEPSDVPAYIRQRDKEKLLNNIAKAFNKVVTEDEMVDMFGEGGAEEVREFYEDEEFSRRADLDAEKEKEL